MLTEVNGSNKQDWECGVENRSAAMLHPSTIRQRQAVVLHG